MKSNEGSLIPKRESPDKDKIIASALHLINGFFFNSSSLDECPILNF